MVLHILGFHEWQVLAASRKQGARSHLKHVTGGAQEQLFFFSVPTSEHNHTHHNSSYLLLLSHSGGFSVRGVHFWATHWYSCSMSWRLLSKEASFPTERSGDGNRVSLRCVFGMRELLQKSCICL